MSGTSLSTETRNTIAAASSTFPGFRFSPTDVELINYYLKKKMEGDETAVQVIPEVEICRYEPWDLPEQSIVPSETEWYFFSARGRKYPNGLQSKRATEYGYWKATGRERNVKSGQIIIGTKRTLVFHLGRAPKGERTEWIMHEYCMEGRAQDPLVLCRLRRNTEFRPNPNSARHESEVENEVVGCSERNIDEAGPSEPRGRDRDKGKGKAVETDDYQSSHGSHSIGQQLQLNYSPPTESEHKLANDVNLSESVPPNKADLPPAEDEFFAEIINDEIIKLDDPSISASSFGAAEGTSSRPPPLYLDEGELELGRLSLQPDEREGGLGVLEGGLFPLQPPPEAPLQGTANRRIKLRRIKPGPFRLGKNVVIVDEDEEYPETREEKEKEEKEHPPKCLVTLWGTTYHTGIVKSVYAVVLLMLFLYLLMKGFADDAVSVSVNEGFC